MKNISVLVLALLTAVTTASAQTPVSVSSRVDFYAQASAVVAFPGDFDTAAGGAVAVGVSLDKVHSLEAQVIRFKSEEGLLDVTFTPILATYKYRIPLAHKLSLKVGGSVGATKERAQHYWWGEENQTAFTYGATGGVSYAFSDHVSFDGNVLALRMENTNITTAGSIAIVTAGVTFRF